MQQTAGAARSQGRVGNIVRANALEVALPKPPEPEPVPSPTPPAPEPKEAQALRDLLVGLRGQMNELRQRRGQTVAEIASIAVEVGVAIAERLLHAEIAANRQRLDRIVLQALERMPPDSKLTVQAHPDDLALLKQQVANLDDADVRPTDLTLKPDPGMPRGQVKLEDRDFFVTWDTKDCLAQLRAALLEGIFTDG